MVLCDHLLRGLNQNYGRSVEGVDDEVLRVFRSYRWPGNVRELENVLARAIINMKYQERIIRVEHLPPFGMGGPTGYRRKRVKNVHTALKWKLRLCAGQWRGQK